MASSNPYRAVDLIKKYGWVIMPYMSSMASVFLGDAALLFVDNSRSEASDADDERHGHTPDIPLNTIDYAVGLCTASRGDVILVCPGHSEAIDSATDLAIDVAGVQVIGIGEGVNRPLLTVGKAATAGCVVTVSGAGCSLKNMRLTITAVDVTRIILVNADDVTLQDLDITQTITSYEAITAIEDSAANTCDRLHIKNVTIYAGTAAGATYGIFLDEVQDRVKIEDCTIIGDFATAPICTNAICTNIMVKNCICKNDNAGEFAIEFSAAATGFIIDCKGHTDVDATCIDPGSCYCYNVLGNDGIDKNAFLVPVAGTIT